MFNIVTVSLHQKGTWLVKIFGLQYCQDSNGCELAFQMSKGESVSQLDCARVLGSMMYIKKCTRSDIVCVVNKVSWFTNNPNQIHWIAMKRVLGYLKHT